jgi:hypothetical protein
MQSPLLQTVGNLGGHQNNPGILASPPGVLKSLRTFGVRRLVAAFCVARSADTSAERFNAVKQAFDLGKRGDNHAARTVSSTGPARCGCFAWWRIGWASKSARRSRWARLPISGRPCCRATSSFSSSSFYTASAVCFRPTDRVSRHRRCRRQTIAPASPNDAATSRVMLPGSGTLATRKLTPPSYDGNRLYRPDAARELATVLKAPPRKPRVSPETAVSFH